ncbi:MAG TPA: DUF58 domain-containing protein [Candidatus Omnitrophota bacterium]|nr:DUF58 domain-containing protein [Candidatus Omnitrophota bacterium]
MPRVEWSFLLPAEDHQQVKWFLAYCQSRLTAWGNIIFLIILAGMAIASVGTHISAYFLPSFILALLMVSYFLSLFFRPHIEARRILPSAVKAGGHCIYPVIVKNTGRRIVRNLSVFESALPYGLYSAVNHPEFNNTISWLDPGEQTTLTLVLRTPRRGTFELSRLIAGSSFPSGIMRSRKRLGRKERLVVYPKFTRQTDFQIDTVKQFQPGGISLSSKIGDSNEFASTREYRHGDRMRDVHWASSARTGRLIVKEYVEEYFVRIGLFVDTELKRFEKHTCFESRLSLCAGIADMLCANNYIVDLFLSDPHHQHMQSGRGLESFDHLLDFLSAPEGDAKVDFTDALALLKRFSRELSALVVFLKDWDQPRAHFIQQLRESGLKVRVIIIRDRPTTWPQTGQEISILKTKEAACVQ